MPKYFFHTDGKRPHIDDYGVELANDSAAWREAVRFLRHLEDRFDPNDGIRIEICRDRMPIYVLTVGSRCLRQPSEVTELQPIE